MLELENAFLLAMTYNLMIIIFSKGFSDSLGKINLHFDSFGAKCIFLWGLAYGAVANRCHLIPALSLLFALEKAFCGHRWLVWMANNHRRLESIIKKDIITGTFFGLYGAGDLLSMVMFLYAAWVARENLFELKI